MSQKDENIKKLMGWCPMKDSLWKERQENFFSGFKSENRNFQLMPSPAGMQENEILKARASIYDARWLLWILFAVFFIVSVSLLIWLYSPEGSFLTLFSGLIWFLCPFLFFLYRPSTVEVISGKILIKRTFRKPLILEKEDVTQISAKKNKDHYFRWLIRLFYVFIIPLFFVIMISNDLRILGGSAPEYPDIRNYLIQLAQLTLFLVLIYSSELEMPFQQVINIITRSNLKLRLYIDEAEEILEILKN